MREICLLISMGFVASGCQHIQLADNPMPVAISQSSKPTKKHSSIKAQSADQSIAQPTIKTTINTKEDWFYLLEDWF